MAIINITSMQELIDALQSIDSYTTLEIKNDLDFNDVVATLTTAISIPTDGSSSNITTDITINGNGYAINNLDNASVSSSLFQFKYCQNVVINDLSFLNCHCTKTSTRLINSQSSYRIAFHNVVVQGKFYFPPFQYCDFYDSMLTFNYCNIALNSATTYTRCWIKFDKCNSSGNVVGVLNNLFSCYLTGEWTYTIPTVLHPLLSIIDNCCINVRFTIINSNPLTLANLFKYDSFTTKINIINKDKFIFSVASELEDTEMCKLVTDEQMKDAEYLADLGFDIIP